MKSKLDSLKQKVYAILSDKNFNIDVQIEALNKEIGDYMLKLSQTDYRVIKYMEGFYSDEEFLPMKEQRQE